MLDLLNLLPFFMAEPAAPPAAPPAEPPAMEGAPPLDPNAPAPGEPPPAKAPGLMGQSGEEDPPPAEPPKHPAEGEPPPAEPAKQGERPTYVPEQFWNDEKKEVDVEAFAKSYSDIRNQNNKLLQDSGGKPLETEEEYLKDFIPPTKGRPGVGGEEGKPLDRFEEGLDAQDPAFVCAAKAAKSALLSKKQFDEFIISYMEEANNLLPEPVNVAGEMEKLGDGGEVMVQTNVNWVHSLKRNGVINQDQHDLLFDFGSTALGVELVNALRTNSGEKPIPINASVNSGAKTPDECQAMIADERYRQDGPVGDSYRAEVDAEFVKTFGTAKQA